MDAKDIEKEFKDLQLQNIRPRKRIDYKAKHFGLKVVVSKLLAALFFLAIALFAMYTVINASNANADARIMGIIAVIYLGLGAYIAIKLWNLEFIGWVALFFISLAGIALPVMSAVSSGIAVGTLPIIAVSAISLAAVWSIRDLYQVRHFRDIFAAPRQ